MVELRGKYGIAKVFTDTVDNESISQAINLLNQPYIERSRIRMMPDIHAGAGCTIGTTMTIQDKVCPNLVGVDIGCGMYTVRIKEDSIDTENLDAVIRSKIPSGFEIRSTPHEYARSIDLGKLYCAKSVDTDRAYRSIGTLGCGNHFIEADRDSDGRLYIVVHSGSRHLGVEIAKYYQNAAYQSLTSYSSEEIKDTIQKMKKDGRQKDIQGVLKTMQEKKTLVPKELAYVEGALFDRYLHDMEIAQRFAYTNRCAIIDTIVHAMNLHVEDQFHTIHNYIDMDHRILRKGAVSAQKGERLLIPINMRDGSLLCTGKGNEDWNYSAPHGAGRLMSRREAKEAFTLQQFEKQMQGVYTTSVNMSTLDECPMAYKSMEDIVTHIDPTVKIETVLKPIYNFKAGDER